MMRKRLQARMYTNAMLTVIALCLAAVVVHDYKLSVASNAYAIEQIIGKTPAPSNFAAPGRSAPVDLGNVSQTQDTAVAAATSDIASANRDIASAIRELADAVKTAGSSLSRPAAAAAPLPAGAVEVGPATK